MIARALVLVSTLVVAVVATLAQLDQQSRLSPAYAAIVPDSFSGNAARERSRIALKLGEGQRAEDAARVQVSLRPMPAESLSILALAAVQAGDIEMARDALGAASQRGWREPVSQLASGQSALEQGQYAIVAQRIHALLATGRFTEPAHALLAQLVATPQGRAAFAEQLAGAGRWQNGLLTSAYDSVEPADWAQTLALAQQRGATFERAQLESLVKRYRRDGREEDIALFWPEN